MNRTHPEASFTAELGRLQTEQHSLVVLALVGNTAFHIVNVVPGVGKPTVSTSFKGQRAVLGNLFVIHFTVPLAR